MYLNCAFSGHRILGKDFNHGILDIVVRNLVMGGTKNFYCGMAMGFDLAAAESVLYLAKTNDINLIACVPCLGQEENFSENNKQRYRRILKDCKEVRLLSEDYYKGCMFARDRYMVDNCDVLVTYQRRKKGGTFYTANYARKKGIGIIEL